MEPTEENLRAFEDAHKARAEPAELPPIVQRTLGDLKGKRVLHLHCGTGEATARLAELGAVATGVDARPAALETARERWPQDPLGRRRTRSRCPASCGAAASTSSTRARGCSAIWTDLAGWATGIAAALREHGELLVFDDHPVAVCVDGFLRWRHDYFRDPADPDRLWRIGQVVSALVRAGLRIEALEEYPGGTARRRHDRRIPATFLLYARRA